VAFKNQVRALTGKKISPTTAAALLRRPHAPMTSAAPGGRKSNHDKGA
jgi:hypothetical protein